MKSEYWLELCDIIGAENFEIFSMRMFGNFVGGQMMISPAGLVNIKEWTEKKNANI